MSCMSLERDDFVDSVELHWIIFILLFAQHGLVNLLWRLLKVLFKWLDLLNIKNYALSLHLIKTCYIESHQKELGKWIDIVHRKSINPLLSFSYNRSWTYHGESPKVGFQSTFVCVYTDHLNYLLFWSVDKVLTCFVNNIVIFCFSSSRLHEVVLICWCKSH